VEALIVLFFLVPILFIFFLLIDPFKAQREAKANREWDRWVEPYKNTRSPDEDPLNKNNGSTLRGKRGGRYEERISKKTGKPYRHYW
tara:strand:- start:297 stop:557 length:261 start_codon:yes stop_codon:yes gene_type:complete